MGRELETVCQGASVNSASIYREGLRRNKKKLSDCVSPRADDDDDDDKGKK